MEEIEEHRIIQVSDLHLLADRKELFLGTNPFDNFSAVMDLVKEDIERNPVELLMFTGDISQDCSAESYQDFCSVVRDISVPMVWIPGNHDDCQVGKKILEKNNIHFQRSLDLNFWKLIFLNSLWPDHIAGYLSDDELSSLDQELEKAFGHDVMIVIHHHPIPTKCPWIDHHILKNANQFFKVIEKYPNVRAVLFGHIHAIFEQSKKHVEYISSPATVFQFDIEQKQFQLTAAMPGYRWYDLGIDGDFATGVNRLDYHQQWLPDLNSEDY